MPEVPGGSTASGAPGALVAIALGSNLGDRDASLDEAVRRIGSLGRVLRVSSFHDTAPVGFTDQPRFLNAAVTIETHLCPQDLLAALLQIERGMGRLRLADMPAKGPRLIDLDLLLYANVVLATETLCVPHPEMLQRRFVLEPLTEIAPGWVVPGTGSTVAQCLADLVSSCRSSA